MDEQVLIDMQGKRETVTVIIEKYASDKKSQCLSSQSVKNWIGSSQKIN